MARRRPALFRRRHPRRARGAVARRPRPLAGGRGAPRALARRPSWPAIWKFRSSWGGGRRRRHPGQGPAMTEPAATTRILMTADAVGGVWQYATDLARGLAAHGV